MFATISTGGVLGGALGSILAAFTSMSNVLASRIAHGAVDEAA